MSLTFETKPSARSGVVCCSSVKRWVYLYGGYTEVRVGRVLTRGRCSAEIWRLKLVPGKHLSDLKLSWQRLSRKGAAPVGRNSFACTGHKRRMVFFGGCDDNDLQEEIQSEFFNDLHAYDMDLGRFFKLELRGNKAKRKKSKKKKKKNKVHGAVDATTVVIASDDESEEDESIEENKILDGYGELDDNKFYYVLDGVIMEMDLNDMSDEDEDENTGRKGKR